MPFAFQISIWLLVTSSLTAIAGKSIGINLGPTYLTSACAKGLQDEYAVVSVKGSKEYRNYFADVLEIQATGNGTNDHDDLSVRAVLYDALTTIKTAMEKKLGHTVDIGVISQPLYFNQTTASALSDAAREVQSGSAGQVTRFTNAARLAYRLNSCQAFGMNASYCDIDEGEHSVVVVDYNTEYLELAIGYVRETICSVRGYKRVKELGEDHKSSSSYLNDLQKVLQEFRGAYFATFDFWDYGAHIRGLVLSGDASKDAMNEMRRSIAQAWPEQHENRFKDTLDPMYVGAIGAARMAQMEALRKSEPQVATEEDEDSDDRHRDEL